MAIYHCSVKIISRLSGRTSVAAAAYRSSGKIFCAWDGITYDYTRKRHTKHQEVLLPDKAPPAYHDRSTLWNAVEVAEKRKDAQTAREIELALPIELDAKEQIQLVRSYVQSRFVDQGMCADIAVHDKGDGNPHAHVMLTTRTVDKSGFGPKNRAWNNRPNVETWREAWATHCNQAFARLGLEQRLDHRSYIRQGIDRVPTVHLGVAASNMEKKGMTTEKGLINQRIRKHNMQYDQELNQLKADLEQLRAQMNIDDATASTSPATHKLIKEYLDLELEKNSYKAQGDKLQNLIRTTSGKIDDLGERAEIIDNFQRKILELKVQIQDLSPLAIKERVLSISQLERIERSLHQARTSLERDYKVSAAGIVLLTQELETKLEQIKQTQAQLPSVEPLQERQQMIELEMRQIPEGKVQTSKALKEISLDRYSGINKIAVVRASNRLLEQVAEQSLEPARNKDIYQTRGR